LGGTCSTHRPDEKCIIFWLEYLKVRELSENLGVDWKKNLKCILGKYVWECANWMHLAQNRDQWRAFVNTVMNLRTP